MANKKYTTFNHANMKSVRDEVQAKLDELKALGLDIRLGNIKFDEGTFTSKVSCTLTNPKVKADEEVKVDKNGVPATWANGCRRLGLVEGDFRNEITLQGKKIFLRQIRLH